MPIDTEHPQYIRMKPIWDECERAIQGQPAIRAAKTRFLPAVSGMRKHWGNGGEDDYLAYRDRARFSDIPAESLEGAMGVLFSKPPKGPIDEVVTADGLTVKELAIECARAVYTKGRYILMVEAPDNGGDAYIARYSAESMPNWKESAADYVSLAVFKEYVPADDDMYSHETKPQYRRYTTSGVDVIDEDGNFVSEGLPNVISGKIAMVVIGAVDTDPCVDTPPVHRIVLCALAAYRSSADLRQSLHISSQPTIWSAGCTDQQFNENSESGTGAGAHWYLGDNPAAKVGFLQFDNASLSGLERDISSELETAAQYSVKLTQINSAETSDSKTIRDKAQKSALANMAESINNGINTALELLQQAGRRKPKKLVPEGQKADSDEYEEFAIQMQDSSEAEATMITAIGNRVNSGGYPRSAEYNYAIRTGLFKGSYEEWLDDIATGGTVM